MILALINLVIGLVETILSLRFILRLLNANPGTPFVNWVYSVTSSLVSPFVGIVPDIQAGAYVIDTTSLFAILIYMIAGFLLVEFISLITGNRR